jgi:hypothetical protein
MDANSFFSIRAYSRHSRATIFFVSFVPLWFIFLISQLIVRLEVPQLFLIVAEGTTDG